MCNYENNSKSSSQCSSAWNISVINKTWIININSTTLQQQVKYNMLSQNSTSTSSFPAEAQQFSQNFTIVVGLSQNHISTLGYKFRELVQIHRQTKMKQQQVVSSTYSGPLSETRGAAIAAASLLTVCSEADGEVSAREVVDVVVGRCRDRHGELSADDDVTLLNSISDIRHSASHRVDTRVCDSVVRVMTCSLLGQSWVQCSTVSSCPARRDGFNSSLRETVHSPWCGLGQLSLPSLQGRKWGPASSMWEGKGGRAGKTVKSFDNACYTWALPQWGSFTKRCYIKSITFTFFLPLPPDRPTDDRIINRNSRISCLQCSAEFELWIKQRTPAESRLEKVQVVLLTSWKEVFSVGDEWLYRLSGNLEVGPSTNKQTLHASNSTIAHHRCK